MPHTSIPPGNLNATLELDNAVQLAGVLSAQLDGRFELDSVRDLNNPDAGECVTIQRGAVATLSVTTAGSHSPLEQATVRVARQSRNRITLEFAADDRALAARYRDAMTDVAATAPAAVPTTEQPDDTASGATRDLTRHPGRRAPALAHTAEYARLLDTLERQSLEELEFALRPFFKDLTAYMRELSARFKQADNGENLHATALSILKGQSVIIIKRMLQRIKNDFRDLAPAELDDPLWRTTIGDNPDKLGLIDLQEFEDYLALDRMVTLGEDLHRVAMEALTLRVGALVDTDPDLVRLPIHVRELCQAFQLSLREEHIPRNVLPHIFDYFAKHFVRQLDGYYAPLNKLLADAGVKPEIEKEIQAKGSLLKRNQPPSRPEQRARRPKPRGGISGSLSEQELEAQRNAIAPLTSALHELNQLQRELGSQLGGALGHGSPANLYRSVVDALNFKREAEGLADGTALAQGTAMSGTWDGATVASADIDQTRLANAESIARVLSELQRNSQVREDVSQSNSLRAYLADNREQIGGLKNSSGLTADSLNQLDMVDNLFGTIKSQLDVSSDLKPALGHLQIPLAKLALLDPRFFVDQTHTARTVVDKLSRLATSANFPNKALESRINTIVDSIVSDYESDDSVFTSALEKIDKLAEQQERALARNIERVVRTQEGQQKLAEARREVARVISGRIHPPKAPKVLLDLIESGWRDLLVLTHVRDGHDSHAWADQIRTLDLLCQWLAERQDGEIDDDLSVQRSMEAEPFIDLIGQQISSALPTNIAHEEVLAELRDVLAGNAEVVAAEVRPDQNNIEPEPGEVRAKIEDLPRLRRWVKRVEQLESNSWLTYRDKGGNKKRMQLAWISPDRDRYIFVNERGQKVADLSAIQLARQLSQGVQPPAPADRLSVVDQSMYSTLEHVQKSLSFARNHDSLTRLINRDTFLDQMQRALRHSHVKHAQHAVLYLNIDQFKLVNEVYDRVTGDVVLLEFAKLLAQMHGKKFSSARMEADEFAILLLDRDIAQAVELAEKIRSDIESSSMDIEGENVSFTVSIGVAAILEHSPAVEEVIGAAQSAMRHAKHQGRNKVVPYEEEQSRIQDFKLEKSRTRQDLESALASDRFVLRAQPIVQTAVGDRASSTLHYELLLGLANKDGTLSSPEEFIQSAERYGFMTLVDRWVVREAFTWISRLMDEQKVVPNLAINLSGASVTDDSFMEYLLEQISLFGVGTSRLCFEITETGTISNLVKAADFVRAFRNIGCKFSIDDFGTGLASHNYLRELPVDYVKIDGSFITGIDKNRNDYAMARSINDLAHFLGQETIAESVENDQIIVKLEEIGVDYLQGWGIGMPKPLVEVTADLSNLEK